MVSAALQKEQYDGSYIKEYLAVVHGRLKAPAGVIRTRVDKFRDPDSGLLLLKPAEEGEGQAAETVYEVLRQADSYAVLRVVIRTGRMHQIRFHMSDAGYPLVGDPLYGNHEKDTSLLYGIRKGD